METSDREATWTQNVWAGSYLDGRSAARQQATIRVLRMGLQVSTENQDTFWWPYAEIRQTQGFYVGEQVRLERGGEIPEALLVSDVSFLSALRRMAPEWAARFHDPGQHRRRARLTFLAGIGVIGILLAIYLWGIPAAAAVVASHVPVAWEERLGGEIVQHLAPEGKRCTDPRRLQVIDALLATLTAPLPRRAYTFRVIVVNDGGLNAFAAPGGYIVLFRGLLDRTQTAEELAGVLAHEVQHILQRHATRALLQHASTGLLLTALAGDAGGAMVYGLQGAHVLGTLRYSRRHEYEADVEGMRMLLEAWIDPGGMIAFFELLQREGKDAPGPLQYISTHPSTEDRIQRLKSLAGQSEHGSVKLLPDYDWRDMRKIC